MPMDGYYVMMDAGREEQRAIGLKDFSRKAYVFADMFFPHDEEYAAKEELELRDTKTGFLAFVCYDTFALKLMLKVRNNVTLPIAKCKRFTYDDSGFKLGRPIMLDTFHSSTGFINQPLANVALDEARIDNVQEYGLSISPTLRELKPFVAMALHIWWKWGFWLGSVAKEHEKDIEAIRDISVWTQIKQNPMFNKKYRMLTEAGANTPQMRHAWDRAWRFPIAPESEKGWSDMPELIRERIKYLSEKRNVKVIQ